MTDADCSTETSEAEELGRIVEIVAAATDTTVSNPQKKSGDVKVHVSVHPDRVGRRQEYGGQQTAGSAGPC